MATHFGGYYPVAFYGLPWITWNGRQAALFDLLSRKFYIFGLDLWPQDIIYLTRLLILSALALFLFTAVASSVVHHSFYPTHNNSEPSRN